MELMWLFVVGPDQHVLKNILCEVTGKRDA